uniref:Tyrosine specific protein phosphatases domain-containing protein n=2 Tax=Knipowitschia caucasica TaxID=637954 RepID=A0AAV2JSJ2_KNICA
MRSLNQDQNQTRTRPESQMLELCKITPFLYISNARSACSTALLLQERITQCINVSTKQPFPAVMLTQLRVSVLDEPQQDLYAHLDVCADAIAAEEQRGGRTLVFCKNGRSRSATVCTAYLLKYQQLSVEGALQLQTYESDLRERREMTSSRSIQSAES